MILKNIFFYADDLQIYLRVDIDQLERGIAALTDVANRVYEWAGNADLKLNASKTKAIICGYRYFVGKIPQELPRIEPVVHLSLCACSTSSQLNVIYVFVV